LIGACNSIVIAYAPQALFVVQRVVSAINGIGGT